MERSRRRASLLAVDAPPGLVYLPSFIDPAEERALLDESTTWEFRQVVMRGQPARRTVIHFGWDYDYDGWAIHPATPPPPSLRNLADRAAAVADVAPALLEQFLVARYPPGATIGWHRDAPMFGTPVVGISLGADCRMKFRRRRDDDWLVHTLHLERRSLYVIGGEARRNWQHSIPPHREERVSITVRVLARSRRESEESGNDQGEGTPAPPDAVPESGTKSAPLSAP